MENLIGPSVKSCSVSDRRPDLSTALSLVVGPNFSSIDF